MTWLNLAGGPFWLNLAILGIIAVVVWVVGGRICYYTDLITQRTGLGKAFVGALLPATTWRSRINIRNFTIVLALCVLTACGQADSPVEALAATTLAPVPTRAATLAAQPANARADGGVATLSDEQLIRQGRSIYVQRCAACHHQNGEGNLLLFPALNGSALVTGQPPTAVIQTVLYGRQEMPSFADTLSPQQIAAVISYIRNAWGNDAPVVTPEQVQQELEAGESVGASR